MFGFENLFFIVLYKLAEALNSTFVDLTTELRGDAGGSAGWSVAADLFFITWLVGTWITILLATRPRKAAIVPWLSGAITGVSAVLWYVALCKA